MPQSGLLSGKMWKDQSVKAWHLRQEKNARDACSFEKSSSVEKGSCKDTVY